MQGGVFGGGVFAGFGVQPALQHCQGVPGGAMFNQPVGNWGAALDLGGGPAGMGGDPAEMGAPAGHDYAAADSTERAESSKAGQQGSQDRQQVHVNT